MLMMLGQTQWESTCLACEVPQFHPQHCGGRPHCQRGFFGLMKSPSIYMGRHLLHRCTCEAEYKWALAYFNSTSRIKF